MDRQIIYPGQIPLETDLLNTNRNTMIALGKLIGALFGTGGVVNGLTVGPNTPAALNVVVSAGEIYQLANVDNTAYSSIPADTTDTCVKQGIQLQAVTLACAAPVTAGFSINYLIEATFTETDTGPVVLPYYNASNPTQAFAGPANSGASQATVRSGQVTLQAKPGIAATTGTQVTPPVDAGYIALAVVTVANGQTTITSGNIAAATHSQILALPLSAGRLINTQSFTAVGTTTYKPTPGTRAIRAVVMGGGAGGGGCAAAGASLVAAGGGGASGTYFESLLFAVPTAPVAVTVGAGGAGGIGANNGNAGGTSSFGALISTPGGAPGGSGNTGAGTTPGGGLVVPPTSTVPAFVSSPGFAGGMGLAFFNVNVTASISEGGGGGSTPYGGGANWQYNAGNGASVVAGANNFGGGGGGALAKNSAAANGGSGGSGAVFIFEYA